VIPGLGHLLAGELLVGAGLVMLVGVWACAAIRGFPRLGSIMGMHALLAVVTWVVVGVLLWRVAWRRAFPRVLSEGEMYSNRQVFYRALRGHRAGMVGLFGVGFLVLVTALTPLVAPFDPIAIDAGPRAHPPTLVWWMGTDEFGRDVFSRVLYGGRISLSIGFLAVFLAATVGTTLGAVSAFAGGLADRVIMFVTDVLLSLPRLVLLLTIVGLFRVTGTSGMFLVVAILGLTAWMGIARIVRSEVLSLKQRDFVQAARALGLSSTRILVLHLIPNAMAPVIVFCSLAIGATMLTEAALSFLGLGVPPPTSSWGVMVNDGREPLRSAPWIAGFPSLAIMLAVLSFNLLGDGLRDALDPKLRG